MNNTAEFVLRFLSLQFLALFYISASVAETAYVQLEEGSHKQLIPLWDSELSRKTCTKGIFEQVQAVVDYNKLFKELKEKVEQGEIIFDSVEYKSYEMKGAELRLKGMSSPTICEAGLVAELTPSTKIELFNMSDECGSTMHKVVVMSGKHLNKVGCVHIEQISNKAPHQ